MKKILTLLILLSVTIISYSQCTVTPITAGMTGLQLRNALNSNFACSNNNTIVNVRDYGAIGDGITNDALAVYSAMTDAIDSSRILYFPIGRYYIPYAVAVNLTNKDLIIYGEEGAEIIGYHDELITPAGWIVTTTNSSNYDIDENIIEGTRYIISSQLSAVGSVGDVIQITSTDLYCNNVYKGELNNILEINSDTVVLILPTRLDYDLTTTHVKKTNPGKITINNMKFTHWRLNLSYMSEIDISNNNFYNCQTLPLVIYYSNNIVVADNYIYQDTVVNTVGYGIDIAGSENWQLTRNEVYNYPQNIVCGGSYPSRNGAYFYNKLSNTSTPTLRAILDTHQGTESVKIEGNRIWGCIYAKGNDIDILYNHVFIIGSSVLGIERLIEQRTEAIPTPPDVRYENIIGNVIRDLKTGFTGTFGLRINIMSARDTADFINIQGNYIKTGGYGIQVTTEGALNCYYKSVNIKDNYIEVTSSSTQQAIAISSISIRDVIIDNNTITGKGSYTIITTNLSINTMQITNNIINTTYWANINVWGMNLLKVKDNIFNHGIAITTGVPYVIYENNVFQNDLGNDPIYIDGASTSVLIKDNNYINNKRTFQINVASVAAVVRDETIHLTGSLTDGAPTANQINGIVGLTAATARNGFKAIIKDSDGTGLVYNIVSDGAEWYWVATTLAL